MSVAFSARIRHTGALARAVAVLAALSLLTAGVAVASSPSTDLLHAHDGPRRVAVDATHQAQPSHFDASSIRVEWSCGICSTQNRQGIGTRRR